MYSIQWIAPIAMQPLQTFAFDFPVHRVGASLLIHGDCLAWLQHMPENSLEAVVTDPPYGVKEYDAQQLDKRAAAKGGVWRIPPRLGGYERAPLPRFTAFTEKERRAIDEFFVVWAKAVHRVLKPGAHVFLASNALLSQRVFSAVVAGGFEFRGEVIRLVRTLRGGDRPKNAEQEFAGVSSMARSGYEPWGIFRKPLPSGMKVSDCLRQFKTGGLRRSADGNPFCDVIASERTPQRERALADHPSLKPQSFLRQLVYAALPLGTGVILDLFMGSGSTVAAAEALGLQALGVERHDSYFALSKQAVPALAALYEGARH